jgi:hypothetical protein
MRKLVVCVAALACCFAAAVAQDIDIGNPVSRFVVLPPRPSPPGAESPTVTLPTWSGTFTYLGVTYSYYMVGKAPSTGTSTTVKAFIIPVKVIIGTHTFSPNKTFGGESVVQQTVESPIFKTQDYVLGAVDIGTTQYVDAFQRANFWGTVKNHTGYHVKLGGPTILPTLTLTPGSSGGIGFPYGVLAGEMDINYFDAQAQSYISGHSSITPDTLPIFLTDNLYLTQGGICCIGGYHSVVGTQSYSHATFITASGVFSQDVSALSHEVGEWMDDPGVKGTFNSIACGALEVGDPEESFANSGAFPYPLGGFTYNLQDLVFLEYFGAPSTTSVNGWETFQGNPFGLSICSNGG